MTLSREAPAAHIPADRRQAIATGETVLERSIGAALVSIVPDSNPEWVIRGLSRFGLG